MSTRSIGGEGTSSSRYHPYSGSHHHHRSSRRSHDERRIETTSSRDYRRYGDSRRTHRHSDKHHSETRRHHRYRDYEETARRVSSLPIPRLPSTSSRNERIKIFSFHQSQHNDPLKMICDAIRHADTKILLKIFHISSETIIQSLVDQGQYIPVCVHYQISPNLESMAAGSGIALDKRTSGAILHKKTMLVDGRLVISGSANYADLSLNKDVNLILKIRSSSLSEMVARSRRGTTNVGDQEVSYYPITRYRDHSRPDIGNFKLITNQINKSQKSVLVAMCALSSSQILQALEQAILRGVYVKIIIDNKETNLLRTTTQGMKIRSHIYERTFEETLHAKACCIDSKTLITGSLNWTGAGLNKNLEDLFVISPLTETQIQSFLEVWQYLEKNSKRVFPDDSDQPSTSSS